MGCGLTRLKVALNLYPSWAFNYILSAVSYTIPVCYRTTFSVSKVGTGLNLDPSLSQSEELTTETKQWRAFEPSFRSRTRKIQSNLLIILAKLKFLTLFFHLN